MAYAKLILGDGRVVVENDFAALTAPGTNTAIEVLGTTNHTYQVTVAAINTSVDVSLQGSIDGTNFFTLPVTAVSAASISFSASVGTITANGTYFLTIPNIPLHFIRGNFSAEVGGTAATVTFKGLSIST